MKTNKLLILTFNLLLLTFYLYSKEEEVQAKIALETNLENRLKSVLSEIIGSEKLVVIINTELYTKNESEIVTPKKEETEEKFSLPGVPLKEKIGEETPITPNIPITPLSLGGTRLLIKKLSATILVERSTPQTVVDIIERYSSGLLGINQSRGDILKVERVDFYTNTNKFSWESLKYPPHIYWISGLSLTFIFLIILSGFLFGSVRGLGRNLLNTISAMRASNETAKKEETEFESIPETETLRNLSETLASETCRADIDKPFSFIKQGDIRNLNYLIQKESPGNVAIIISYLSPELSHQVLSSLLPQKRSQVALCLSKVTEFEPEQVKSLEMTIKTKIQYIVGGEDKIVSILDFADEELQSEILKALEQREPEVAQKVSSGIFKFEDISQLNNTALSIIIRRIGFGVFAQLLKTVSTENQNLIFGKFSEGLAIRLKQEMELGQSLSQKRIDDEKRRVVDIVRRLEKAGVITIKKSV